MIHAGGAARRVPLALALVGLFLVGWLIWGGNAAPRPLGRVAGVASPLPPTQGLTWAQAQEGGSEPGTEEMGHEPWEGRNWGLLGAGVFSLLAGGTAIVLLSVIGSWPHRRQ